MNALIALALLIAGPSAMALDKITCKGNADYGSPSDVVMTLTALGEDVDGVAQGVEVPYRLTVFKSGKEWTDLTVRAQQADVVFNFEGNSRNGGHIVGTIFKDELEQSTIFIYKQQFVMDCGG